MNEYIIEDKKVDIMQEDWDVLVILDACRYDVFKEVYKKILKDYGELKKAISCATHTVEFLNKIFKDKYFDDIIYISANAFPNSLGIPTGKTNLIMKNHVKRIIDVWNDGWNDKLGTVHPEEVNKHSIVSMDIYRNKRFIIHYMQPHEPSIYFGGGNEYGGGIHFIKNRNVTTNNIMGKLSHYLKRIFSDTTVWKVCGRLNMLPERGTGWYWYKYGNELMKVAYKEDVKLVLEYVKKLLIKYPMKKFVITADHGQRLGERGYYGHTSITTRDKEIIEVPWLVVE